jgi:hypothetical protein
MAVANPKSKPRVRRLAALFFGSQEKRTEVRYYCMYRKASDRTVARTDGRRPNDMAFSCEALLRPPTTQVNKISGGGRSVRASAAARPG